MPRLNRTDDGSVSQHSADHSEVLDYVLCGQVNLHKSPACAAQFTKYITYALKNYRLDQHGNISDGYIPSNRTPRTVTEWHSQRQLPQGREFLNQDPNSNEVSESFQERLGEFLREARANNVPDDGSSTSTM